MYEMQQYKFKNSDSTATQLRLDCDSTATQLRLDCNSTAYMFSSKFEKIVSVINAYIIEQFESRNENIFHK